MSDSPLSSDEEVLVLALKTEEEKKKRKNNMGVWFMRFKRGRKRLYNTDCAFLSNPLKLYTLADPRMRRLLDASDPSRKISFQEF